MLLMIHVIVLLVMWEKDVLKQVSIYAYGMYMITNVVLCTPLYMVVHLLHLKFLVCIYIRTVHNYYGLVT